MFIYHCSSWDLDVICSGNTVLQLSPQFHGRGDYEDENEDEDNEIFNVVGNIGGVNGIVTVEVLMR